MKGRLPLGECLDACFIGYYPNSLVCAECSPDCYTCAGALANQCKSCSNAAVGHELFQENSLNSVTGQCLSACFSSYYAEAGQNVCVLCPENCTSCNSGSLSSCKTCKATFVLQPNAGTPGVGTCQKQCNDGYALVDLADVECDPCHGDCVRCAKPVNVYDCLSCANAALFIQNRSLSQPSAGECVSQCDEGYFVEGAFCKPCAEHCKTCLDASHDQCRACFSSYVFQPNFNLSTEGYCTTNCIQGYYNDNQICVSCYENCTACHNSSLSQCTSCLTGTTPKLLLQPSNTSQTTTGFCVSACHAGYALRAPSSLLCEQCDPSCALCAAADDSTQCTLCYDSGERVQEISNSYPVGKCVGVCDPGYYAGSTHCEGCSGSCKTCSGPEHYQCTSCKAELGLSLQPIPGEYASGICVSLCNSSWALQTSNNTCLACDSSCAECGLPQDPDKCLSCSVGSQSVQELTVASGPAGRCVDECFAHYVAEGGECVICHGECHNCTKSLNRTACTSCYSNVPSFQTLQPHAPAG